MCLVHFRPDERRKSLTGKMLLNKDAVPSIFASSKTAPGRKLPRKRSLPSDGPVAKKASVASDICNANTSQEGTTEDTSQASFAGADYCVKATTASTEEQLEAAQLRIKELEEINSRLSSEKGNLVMSLAAKPDQAVRFYTGFPSFKILMATFEALKPTAEKMISWSQMQRVNQRKQSPEDANFLSDTMRNCKLDLFNQLFLFLQKLRVGSFDLELADKFQVSTTTVSRIIITWTNFLYFTLGSMPIWPSRGKIQENMPTVFKDLYPQCRGILDASEIKIQAPSSLVINSECYSSYKSHTTLKGNVFITPSGEVSHVSALYAGSISDKELTRLSGLLDLLEPGDQILADKGYKIQDLLEPLQCTLAVPAYLSSKGQFSKEEIRSSKAVHNLRVHVERAIRRVKEFHLFDGIIPLTMGGSINQLWTVASLLTNFQGPLFYKHKP